MAEIITKTLLTFFCMYGFIGLLQSLFEYIVSKNSAKNNFVIVIKVLNSEKTLEGTIRMIVWRALSITHGSFTPNILIVDMGSTDATFDIAQRLCKDYSFINYVTYEEYLKKKEE